MINIANRNISLYKYYRMVSYDYVFYNVISYIFLTLAKGLDASQIMYLTGFYSAFVMIFQITTNYFVEKIGLKRSMVIGNLCWIIHCSILILTNNFLLLIVAEAFCSFGTTLKSLTETQVLYTSLRAVKREGEYSKMEGNSVSKFYVLESISSLVVGYLFNIHSYIPILLTLTFLVISFIISLFFIDIEYKWQKDRNDIKDYIKSCKVILNSKRLISIFIYVFVMSGFISVFRTLQKDMVVNLNVSVIKYSIIFAVLTLFVGIGYKCQYKFESITKRKTLTVIGYTFGILAIILGIINSIFEISDGLVLSTVIILVICNFLRGIYTISVKKYINNFTTSNVRGKILSAYSLFENFGKSVLSFVSAGILDSCGSNATAIIFGILCIFTLFFIFKYMNGKLGLNAEEYKKSEIYGVDIQKK